MDEGLPRNDAEEVDEAFSRVSNIISDSLAGGGGIKNGKIDIRVGVGRVKEATKADSIRSTPEFEYTVHVEKVFKEATMLMPALPCTNRSKHS